MDNAGEDRQDGPVRQQNVSLTPIAHRVLRVLARDERGGNISATVARLVRDEAARRFGSDWRSDGSLLSEATSGAAA